MNSSHVVCLLVFKSPFFQLSPKLVDLSNMMQYFYQYHVEQYFFLGWVLNVAPPPTDPNAYVEDQAVRFHRPFQAKTQEIEASNEQKFQESRRPHATDWRHGPAQYWYD